MLKDSWAKNETSGTSYNFWRLLDRSPHIGGYVQSLFIMDHGPIQGGSSLRSVAVDVDESVPALSESEGSLDQTNQESLLYEHDNAEYEPRGKGGQVCLIFLHF